MSYDAGRVLPTLAEVHHLGILFPIPVLRCTKQLFPQESVLLHCKQNGGSRQVCDGHDAFWMALVFWPLGTNKLVYHLQVTSYNRCWWQGAATENLLKSCNSSSLADISLGNYFVLVLRRLSHIQMCSFQIQPGTHSCFLHTDTITLQLFCLLCTHVKDSLIELFGRLDERQHIVKQIGADA